MVKNYVTEKNATFKSDYVIKLTDKSFDSNTNEDWKNGESVWKILTPGA
jgi:hypothetical protein